MLPRKARKQCYQFYHTTILLPAHTLSHTIGCTNMNNPPKQLALHNAADPPQRRHQCSLHRDSNGARPRHVCAPVIRKHSLTNRLSSNVNCPPLNQPKVPPASVPPAAAQASHHCHHTVGCSREGEPTHLFHDSTSTQLPAATADKHYLECVPNARHDAKPFSGSTHQILAHHLLAS